jgi:hypothetical protein
MLEGTTDAQITIILIIIDARNSAMAEQLFLIMHSSSR